ncbi:phage baseplate assembly protein V [uncultured Desulfovibrio sp.]|uniref:phage baseplate assembly protein V n=1 Tax=uncultured Desulfovibrio sp. TaxID=167968 RepID=UPI002599EC39|nr:phage baseplate assembly protein V [uncultured Desulfovibrio sp.]
MSEEQVRDVLAQMVRVGFVSARQPEKMRVRVELRDTTGAALITDWLPVLCPRAHGDAQYDLPDVDDQVLCLFLPFGLEQGFVLGAMYGKASPPVSSGDKWHRSFSDGTVLEYDRASHALTGKVRGLAGLSCSGPMTLEAPIVYVRGTLVNTAKDGSPGSAVISGDVKIISGGVTVPDADVIAGAVSLLNHLTSGVQPGSGQSGAPVGGGSGAGGNPGGGSGGEGQSNEEKRFDALWGKPPADTSDLDKLLLCLPEIAAAMAERQSNAADRQGWLYLREMFLRWFTGAANDNADACTEPLWVDWEWIMSFERAWEAYENFCGKGQIMDLHYQILNGSAQDSLGRILQREGYLGDAPMPFDFIQSPWARWEALYHTLKPVPGFSPTVDGMTAAFSGFTLRALASGRADPIGNGSYRIRVERIAVFAHDKFNFAESGEIHGDRLGAWNCEKRSFQRSADADHIALDNSVFRAFRERYGMGNDFLVLSQPHTVETFPGATYVYP